MKNESISERAKTGSQLITFRLGVEFFGIYVSRVREILRPLELFPVPGMGEGVEGVINLRGEIIPIVKIETLLGIRSSIEGESSRKRRMIIIDASGGSFGFFVDEVLEVAKIQASDIQFAPALGSEDPRAAGVIGIAKISGRMVVCIDPEKIITDDIMAKEISIGD